jgi:Fic family protein
MIFLKIFILHQRKNTDAVRPFLDGNGRIGRLPIAALLEHWNLLAEPLLYLNGYLKQ